MTRTKHRLEDAVDRIAGECIAVRMRMLNRIVTNLYDEALRPLGLRVSQMNILVATAKMGTVRPAEIGARLHLEASTLSRNVERMKERGWLEVVPDEDGLDPAEHLARGPRVLDLAAFHLDVDAQVSLDPCDGVDDDSLAHDCLRAACASAGRTGKRRTRYR